MGRFERRFMADSRKKFIECFVGRRPEVGAGSCSRRPVG